MIQIILYSYAPEYSVIIIRTHPYGHGMKIYNILGPIAWPSQRHDTYSGTVVGLV